MAVKRKHHNRYLTIGIIYIATIVSQGKMPTAITVLTRSSMCSLVFAIISLLLHDEITKREAAILQYPNSIPSSFVADAVWLNDILSCCFTVALFFLLISQLCVLLSITYLTYSYLDEMRRIYAPDEMGPDDEGFQIFRFLIRNHAMTDDPRFAEPIPNVTVALGRDASLPCVVENLGSYKVAWIHIDRQMILTIHRHVISRVPRFSVSHDNAKTWLLHVSSVQQEDRGYYMCQVNTNPMISQVGYLQVVVPPNILDAESTQSTVAIRENQNISLTCKADGFPTPKIMWRKEDGQPILVERRKKVNVYHGEQLNLTRISRSEMGAYLCIATNGVPPSVSKRIILDVEFSPMIWVPNQLVGAPSGTDVTIDCHTEAYPRAISYWVYENVMLLPNKKYGTENMENSYRAHMKLTVRNLQTGDFGNYRCISKNSLGETEGSIRLYEIPMPSTPPKATEMKSSSNKEGAGKRNTSRALGHDEYPKIMVSSSDKRNSQPDLSMETGLSVYTPSGPSISGSVSISKRWAPEITVLTVHILFSGPRFIN